MGGDGDGKSRRKVRVNDQVCARIQCAVKCDGYSEGSQSTSIFWRKLLLCIFFLFFGEKGGEFRSASVMTSSNREVRFVQSLSSQHNFQRSHLCTLSVERNGRTQTPLENEDHIKSRLGDGSCPPVKRSTPHEIFSCGDPKGVYLNCDLCE